MPSKDEIEAMRMAGFDEAEDFYPADFPTDVPTIPLEKISLSRIINDDNAEAERLFEICRTTGFFYLDMLDHHIGRQLWRSACRVHHLGRQKFKDTPVEEKLKYKTRPGVRVFDRGYLMRTAYSGQQSADLEILNIPQSEFFGIKDPNGSGLPDWIPSSEHEDLQDALECGNTVARSIISVLEKQLQLPTHSLTRLHHLTDDSGDFVRVLRYGGVPPSTVDEPEGFPPHRDAMSVAIVFNWVGGLQVPAIGAKVDGYIVNEEDWRWVKPEAGYAIVNLGDAMAIYSNQLLKSQIHRVVKAPGPQREHDRYSVIVATRPENNSLMKAFESPVIPICEDNGNEEAQKKPMTSIEWGYSVVSKIQQRSVRRGATDLDNLVNEKEGVKAS